uniref:Reverse transcriptase domain-containing protein n=1 Tax=Cannabis sativa TaxID=3483 RepID=A0A803QDA7_CANSA
MLAQITFGSPSFPYPFMHSISVLFFRWRRIIALWLGRRGSRPPAAQMAHVSPHLPGYTYFRYIFLLLFYLKPSIFFSDHPSPVLFTTFSLLSFSLLYLPMANLPTSQSTHLTPEEALVHDFDHVSLHPEPQTHSFCLVVKILSPKTLKIDWIQKAMNEAWVARCPFTFSEYHSGLFLVQFGCEGDRRRVMEGQPWNFDRSLMIFAIPDGFDTILPSQLRYIPLWVQVHFIPFGSRSYGLAQFVADAIGDLIEVHLISVYDSVTPFMRVRVLLDTTKPLHRGMNVRFRKLSLTKWLKFLYEGIQNYCYHCGKLDHTFNKCDKFLHHCDHHPFPLSLSYKDALRAPAKSIYKKSIFELSNSIPFEEQPSLTNLDHHSLQDQTNRFLATTMPTTFPATVASSPSPNFIQHTTAPTSNTTYSSQPQTVHPTLHCSLPTHPIMTTTTLPTTSKGKAPMYPQPSLVSLNSPPLSSLNINDSPAAPSSTRKSFHLSCYYGYPYVADKQTSWTLLHRLFDTAPLSPWLIIGDFNDYLGFNDRNTRGLPPPHAMHSFQSFIGKYSLFPLVFSGSRFTWKHGTTLDRLDWAIVNQKWADLFPMASLQHLGFFGSDHRALKVLLEGNPVMFARNPTFRFDNHWLLEPDFPKLLRDSWSTDSNSSASNNPILTFLSKQNNCSVSLSSWGRNKNQFSNRIKSIQSDMERLMVGPTVSPSDVKKANDLQKNLDSLLVKEEIFWKQRSRVNWLKADNSQVTTLNDITTSFVQFYTDLFASQGTQTDAMTFAMQGLSKRLTPTQSTFLISPFTFDEVKAALFQLASDKAPGSDGFNPSFFQKNWDSAGKDLCQAALYALTTNADLRPVNETILVLIPKVKNAEVKDFAPSPLLHSLQAWKVGWLCSNRYGKAFDKVEWAYIEHILQHFGFPYPFISLILNYLSSVSFRLRINNCLSHQILPTRRIRQGDPLSPYLFLLVVEGLSGIINAKTHSNSFHGISISRSAPTISHLLFADDSLLFTKAWRILTTPDSLVGQILKAKYFKRNDFLHASTGHSPSFCWRSILWGRDLLIKGLIWKVGDGTLVNISESNWLPSHGKALLKPGLSPPSQNVSYFLTEDRHWDLSKLRCYFDEEMCNAILAVPIDPHNNDTLIWNHHHSGCFTVNSAYHLANSTFPHLVLLILLPTGVGGPQSGLLTSLPKSNILFGKLSTTFFPPILTFSTVGPLPPLFAPFVSLIMIPTLTPLSNVPGQEYRDAQNRISISCHTSHRPSPNFQVPDATYQLSVDAALSQSTNKHGYGAVVTDSKGTVIATLTATSHSALPPIFAEAEALHRALLWCQAVRFPIAVITSDCQTLVHRIQKFSPDRSALSGLVALIVSSLSSFPGAVVRHIPRSTNTTAHDVARSALGTDKERIWNHFSSSP